MKNFMKSKITQLVLIFVISLGLALGFLLSTKSTANKNAEKRLLKQLQTFFSEVTIYEELEVEDLDLLVKGYKLFDGDEEIGLVFEGKTTNKFASPKGFIHLMIGIASDKTVKGIRVLEIDQSQGVNDSLKNLELYVEKKIGEQLDNDSKDIITGSTTTLSSFNELMLAFEEGFLTHNTAITAPFTDLFGDDYNLIEDEEFVGTDYVVSKADARVDGKLEGYIFTLQNSGVYHANNEGNIELLVAVIDGKIKGFEFSVYEHTTDIPVFQANVLNFLDQWLDTDLESYPTLEGEDLKTESTNTTTMVNKMLSDLRDVYIDFAKGPFKDIFGNNIKVVKDNTFISTTHVISKSDVIEEEEVVGYMFTLQNSGVYHSSSEGAVEMLVAVKGGKIVGYKFTLYEHTPVFKGNVDRFVERWIGTDLLSYPDLGDVNLKTESTNSTTMVDTMLRQLKDEFIKLGGGE